MAERYPEVPLLIDPIEARINKKFNQLIVCLNRRREQLIAEHRERQEEKRAETISRIQTLQQLTDTRTHLQTEMKEKVLHSMRARMLEEIETKMRQLEVVEREVDLTFECDTRQLEETISVLGQLRDVSIPNYPALLEPRISVGKEGAGQGALGRPNGIVFDENTQLVYVTDRGFYLKNAGISVFSVTGEYINTFCEGLFEVPIGIAINGNEVFVSDTSLHSILHFKLPGFQLITKVGKKGTGKGEFSSPRQLTVANGSVFVADTDNNRIVVMTCKLKFQKSISHASMTGPRDVKLLDNKVFVLSWSDNPCLHVFSQSGGKLRSFITRDKRGNEQVKEGYFFCFDKQQNILISDFSDRSIKVFSQEGALLHTLGYTQEEEEIIKPMGIVVTNDNKIICASSYTMYRLHIFF